MVYSEFKLANISEKVSFFFLFENASAFATALSWKFSWKTKNFDDQIKKIAANVPMGDGFPKYHSVGKKFASWCFVFWEDINLETFMKHFYIHE